MTFHELSAFSKKEEREERLRWQHTAAILALLGNCHRGKNSRPLKPADFYPFETPHAEASKPTAEEIKNLIDEFTR